MRVLPVPPQDVLAAAASTISAQRASRSSTRCTQPLATHIKQPSIRMCVLPPSPAGRPRGRRLHDQRAARRRRPREALHAARRAGRAVQLRQQRVAPRVQAGVPEAVRGGGVLLGSLVDPLDRRPRLYRFCEVYGSPLRRGAAVPYHL